MLVNIIFLDQTVGESGQPLYPPPKVMSYQLYVIRMESKTNQKFLLVLHSFLGKIKKDFKQEKKGGREGERKSVSNAEF